MKFINARIFLNLRRLNISDWGNILVRKCEEPWDSPFTEKSNRIKLDSKISDSQKIKIPVAAVCCIFPFANLHIYQMSIPEEEEKRMFPAEGLGLSLSLSRNCCEV
jgi:hypothetical protein